MDRCTTCPILSYFNHSIHVNKGIGCASCHGRVDQMPLMYAQNTLQMEWCLDCHRNPAKNIRPTSEIYNMAWEKPASDRPVWCSVADERRRAYGAERELRDEGPGGAAGEVASLQLPTMGEHGAGGDAAASGAASRCRPTRSSPARMSWVISWWITTRFATPKDLTSCEVCHR